MPACGLAVVTTFCLPSRFLQRDPLGLDSPLSNSLTPVCLSPQRIGDLTIQPREVGLIGAGAITLGGLAFARQLASKEKLKVRGSVEGGLARAALGMRGY